MSNYLRQYILIISLGTLFRVAFGSACLARELPSSPCKRDRIMSDVVADSLFRVTKVIDGDTFWVEGDGRRFKVRFIGVDAPEIRNSQHKKKGYFASEAKEFVRRLCEGKFVRLEYDVQRTDRYQRDLAYVYLEDGTFLNAALLQGGYAVVATFPPNVRYVDYFLKLQRKARAMQNGLWAQ